MFFDYPSPRLTIWLLFHGKLLFSLLSLICFLPYWLALEGFIASPKCEKRALVIISAVLMFAAGVVGLLNSYRQGEENYSIAINFMHLGCALMILWYGRFRQRIIRPRRSKETAAETRERGSLSVS